MIDVGRQRHTDSVEMYVENTIPSPLESKRSSTAFQLHLCLFSSEV